MDYEEAGWVVFPANALSVVASDGQTVDRGGGCDDRPVSWRDAAGRESPSSFPTTNDTHTNYDAT